MMTLLWLNALVAAATTTVWLMWTVIWIRRGCWWHAVIYALAAAGALLFGLGMLIVIAGGDPEISAQVARRWAALALGMPALARLLELVREERRQLYADRLMLRAEQRADAHDERERNRNGGT